MVFFSSYLYFVSLSVLIHIIYKYFLAALATSFANTLASRYPGQNKDTRTTILYSTIKYTKAQSLVEDAHTWKCTPDMWTNLCDWTRKHVSKRASLKVRNLNIHMYRAYCTYILIIVVLFMNIPFHPYIMSFVTNFVWRSILSDVNVANSALFGYYSRGHLFIISRGAYAYSWA